MPDIDDALARAYAPIGTTPVGAGPRRAPAGMSGPHFAIETPPLAAGSPRRDAPSALAWPELVRALERAHGERFDSLAEALLSARDARGTKLLLFTSPHRAEGRTTLVLCLARALARRPGRTLIVDGDLGGPMIARQLGLRPGVGLEDVIERGAAAADALIEAPDDHLVLLPARAPATRPREAVASPEWTRLMGRLRREFDLVLIDGGPLFPGLSAAVTPASVDAAILVDHKGQTAERSLVRARQALDAAGVDLLGLAETFCPS